MGETIAFLRDKGEMWTVSTVPAWIASVADRSTVFF